MGGDGYGKAPANLKPCPFCGSDKLKSTTNGKEKQIVCYNCRGRMRAASWSECIANWNQRAVNLN